MKATGIVRRIDELGRVVIPKEIRRTLRIREGDPLEIFTDRDGEVILKKYSPIGELSDFAKEFADSLHSVMGHVALICDKDSIICASGTSKREFVDKSISSDLESLIDNRQKISSTRGESKKFYNITNEEDENSKYNSQVIVPIIAEGDAIGAVILLSKDTDGQMGVTEMKVAETAAGFVGRQMEQ